MKMEIVPARPSMRPTGQNRADSEASANAKGFASSFEKDREDG